MLAGLMMVTPSGANEPSQAATLARAHHAPYPGPPVPERFAAALVATEDHRFHSELGLDPLAIARVIVGRLTSQPDQGGSTLYQQLARMLYTPGGSGLTAEAEQFALGVKLAFSYSKAEILQMYADIVYFGRGYYGLQEASCGYFGVSPAALSWPQAAMLAGLLPAPSAYDPIAHLPLARAREQHVLDRLVATGQLTQAQANRAFKEPLHIFLGREPGVDACRREPAASAEVGAVTQRLDARRGGLPGSRAFGGARRACCAAPSLATAGDRRAGMMAGADASRGAGITAGSVTQPRVPAIGDRG